MVSALPVTYTLADLDAAAGLLLKELRNHRVVALHGDMGAGKTTLISRAMQLAGSSDAVGSPTFAIMNQYALADGATVWHMDWYRLSSLEEALDAGVEDTLLSGDLALVEWPDKFPELIPLEAIHLSITLLPDGERCLQYFTRQ